MSPPNPSHQARANRFPNEARIVSTTFFLASQEAESGAMTCSTGGSSARLFPVPSAEPKVGGFRLGPRPRLRTGPPAAPPRGRRRRPACLPPRSQPPGRPLAPLVRAEKTFGCIGREGMSQLGLASEPVEGDDLIRGIPFLSPC